jgi:hypothetical protein
VVNEYPNISDSTIKPGRRCPSDRTYHGMVFIPYVMGISEYSNAIGTTSILGPKLKVHSVGD